MSRKKEKKKEQLCVDERTFFSLAYSHKSPTCLKKKCKVIEYFLVCRYINENQIFSCEYHLSFTNMMNFTEYAQRQTDHVGNNFQNDVCFYKTRSCILKLFYFKENGSSSRSEST
jgi:hypothetical protein